MLKKNYKFNIWEYLYYKTTLFYSKTESKFGFEDNKRRASYIVGLFISLNIESLLMLIIALFFTRTPFLLDYMGFVILGLFLFIIFYAINFFEKKRHIKIFETYKDESQKQKNKNELFLAIYIIASIILLITTVYIGRTFWVG